MTLHAVINDTPRRVYCGPAAIAAVSGRCLSTVKEAIYATRGRYAIRGMTTTQLINALGHLGYPPGQILDRSHKPAKDRLTLARYVSRREQDGRELIVLTSHCCAIESEWYVDNATLSPASLRRAPNRRGRVKTVIEYPEFS